MDMTVRRKALEQTILQATQQIGRLTEQLIGAKAQLALIDELAKEPRTVSLAQVVEDLGPNGIGTIAGQY